MGELGKGCDIVFVINGDYKNAIRMGSDLSSGEVFYKNIAQALSNAYGKREQLKDALKLQNRTRLVSEEDLLRDGVVHNCTVASLVRMYPDRDWTNIDQSTKLFATEWFQYYGKDFSNMIIKQNGGDIIVIDPKNTDQVNNLYNYLKVKGKLKQLDESSTKLLEESSLNKAVEQLPNIIKSTESIQKEINNIQEKAKTAKISNYLSDRLVKLKARQENLDKFKKNTPKNVISLIQDYLDDHLKYFGLSYKDEDRTKSLTSELDKIINILSGKSVKDYTYNDVFANEVSSRSTYKPRLQLSAISKYDFTEALMVKSSDLDNKIKDLNSFGDQGEYKKQLTNTKNKIDRFLKKNSKSNKDWFDIINFLIDQTDDEFSYHYQEMDNTYIYLKNVPMTLESKYQDFNYKSIELMKPVEDYKGYNIYIDPSGKYYFSRHILTTKSYGRQYNTLDECKNSIDKKIFDDPISQQNLIEFKYKVNDVVWLPNQFLPEQVIRVLHNPKWEFSAYQELNEFEENLIYDTGIHNKNNLYTFYDYIVSITDFNNEIILNLLKQYVDTAEKAACFIYELNSKLGTLRSKISKGDFTEILNTIKEATYKYYVVQKVQGPYTGGRKRGFKKYYNNSDPSKKEKTEKGVYQTTLLEVKPSEISGQTVKYDQTSGRLLPSIRLLRDLAEKIKDKFGVTVHIETQSTLEDLFKKWKEPMPDQVNGFIKNGEIYINSSVASADTAFHEFAHIILGILKAKNFDNYYDLVNAVGNHKSSSYEKKSMRKLYPNRAESDINEEVFANKLANYLMGKNLGEFLNPIMDEVKKDLDQKMSSIFGKDKLPEEFYGYDLSTIFSQFSHDLGILIEQDDNLKDYDSSNYRKASNWIEEQIAIHKDDENIGILEDCE